MSDRRRSAREAIALLTDDFTELPTPPRDYAPDGPLTWHGYDTSRARAAERTGEEESVVWGRAVIGARTARTVRTASSTETEVIGTGTAVGVAPPGTSAEPRQRGEAEAPSRLPTSTAAVLISFEFGFLGGSLGERTGDRLEAAYTYAREHRLPVVALVATGGSRMQEGMRALTQLQRVARESALTRRPDCPRSRFSATPRRAAAGPPSAPAPTSSSPFPTPRSASPAPESAHPTRTRRRTRPSPRWRRARSTRWSTRTTCATRWPSG